MKMNYTPDERNRLAQANINAAFDYLEELMDYPEEISSIPDGAIVIPPTGDEWVDQQNGEIAKYWSEKEQRPIVHITNLFSTLQRASGRGLSIPPVEG